MGQITYRYKNNLYINITNQCPNNCEFCDIQSISKHLNVDLVLQSEPDLKEIIRAINKSIVEHEFNEIVFCGGGEPLMRLNTLLATAKYIDKNYSIKTRLNTIGYPAKFYKNANVAQKLAEAGFESINISVNTANATEYKEICHPNIKNAYQKTLKFVKDCKKAGLDTRISCVDYEVDLTKFKELAQKLDVVPIIRRYSEVS